MGHKFHHRPLSTRSTPQKTRRMPSLTTTSSSVFSFLFRTLVIASWCGVALVVNGEHACHNNAADLNAEIRARVDYETVEIFRLCTGSTLDFSPTTAVVEGVTVPVDNTLYLYSNTILMCGDDGDVGHKYVSSLFVPSWSAVVCGYREMGRLTLTHCFLSLYQQQLCIDWKRCSCCYW
jgi:hypothetical protein